MSGQNRRRSVRYFAAFGNKIGIGHRSDGGDLLPDGGGNGDLPREAAQACHKRLLAPLPPDFARIERILARDRTFCVSYSGNAGTRPSAQRCYNGRIMGTVIFCGAEGAVHSSEE
ncbi:hypothetical protein [Paraburkholderia hospita]|jgi:hypothetical protein|uniref:hypothetical protein n=1 Tax=Paraburkholderia hospita TaxID=169430 RepID=UPI001ABEDE50|nr:hypothetical protein [Paraburkholderia hospita]